MTVFADAFFWIALLNRRDEYHPVVSRFALKFQGRMVTTHWILAEVADAFAGSSARRMIKSLVADLEDDPSVMLLEANAELFQRGLELYHERPDKCWSLTDCISFVVMRDQGLIEALTGDHHFTQAGFHPVFGE
jgi:predicted nucleic acid-binding protein